MIKKFQIQGNIGVGKSTFIVMLIRELEKICNSVKMVSEPVDTWTKLKSEKTGKNLLETFYNDKERWSYTFQNIAYITRLKSVIHTLKSMVSGIIIEDRSPETDKEIFAQMLRDDGMINDLEWECYMEWYNFYIENIYKDGKRNIIYLRCSPEIAYHRVHTCRHRPEEAGITLEYLRKVHDYHEKWLNYPQWLSDRKEQDGEFSEPLEYKELEKKKHNILILNCDEEFEHDPAVVEDLLKQTIDFIKKAI